NAIRSRYLPLPPGVCAPHDWGRPAHVRELLADGFVNIEFHDAWFPIVAGSAEEARDRWLLGFGPMRATYAVLGDAHREALQADLLELFRQFEVEGVGMVMPREAILVTAAARPSA